MAFIHIVNLRPKTSKHDVLRFQRRTSFAPHVLSAKSLLHHLNLAFELDTTFIKIQGSDKFQNLPRRIVFGERPEITLDCLTFAQNHGMLLGLLFRLGNGHLLFADEGIKVEAATVTRLN